MTDSLIITFHFMTAGYRVQSRFRYPSYILVQGPLESVNKPPILLDYGMHCCCSAKGANYY